MYSKATDVEKAFEKWYRKQNYACGDQIFLKRTVADVA